MTSNVNQFLINSDLFQASPRESSCTFADKVWFAGKIIFFPVTLLAEGVKLICYYLSYGSILNLFTAAKIINSELRENLANMGGEPIRAVTEDHVQLEGMHFENPTPIRDAKTIFLCSGCPFSYEFFVGPMVDALLQMGHHVAIFNYRGFGRSEGSPSERGFYLDAEAIYQYLVHEKNLSDSEIVPFGYSMGSAIATDLAAHHPLDLVLDRYFSSMSSVAYDTCAKISCTGALGGGIMKSIFYLGGAHFDVQNKIQHTSRRIFLARTDQDEQMLPYHTDRIMANLVDRNVVSIEAFSRHVHNQPGNLWFHQKNENARNREPRERLENFLSTPLPA